MATATSPLPVTPDIVLAFVAQLVEAHDTRRVSAQHFALAELLRVARSLPPDARWAPPPAPTAEIRRELNKDGLAYVLAAEDGGKFVRFTLFDVTGDDAMAHLEPAQVRDLVRDLLSVLAALEARR